MKITRIFSFLSRPATKQNTTQKPKARKLTPAEKLAELKTILVESKKISEASKYAL